MNRYKIISILVSIFCSTTRATQEPYDIIIIGSGPAGLTAATYAARAKLNPLVIEGKPGGTLMSVEKIQNWPCFESISGFELMQQMLKQAKKAGATIIHDTIRDVDLTTRPFTLSTHGGKKFQARALVITTGMTPKKIGCPGEQEYYQKGICNCALCDAPLFDKLDVVIAGGGIMALQNAKFLTKYANKIIIINNQEALSGPENLINEISQSPKVTVLNNCNVTAICGDGEKITHIAINGPDQKEQNIPAAGIFVSLGYEPNTALFKDKLTLTSDGKIKINHVGHTSVPGVFAAGAAATIPHEQAIICAASGCIAAIEAGNFVGKSAPKNLVYRCQTRDLSVS